MKKYVKPHQVIPRFYGIAYRDYCANHAVAYPLGINLIVLLWRDFVDWLKWPKGNP